MESKNFEPLEHWEIHSYSRFISRLLKDISEDIYCFAPGNESLTFKVRNLQLTIDGFKPKATLSLVTTDPQINMQPLYNVFATDYAAKAIGIIKKANLLFPGLLELFGKSQFLGERKSISPSASPSAEPDDYL